MNDFSFMVTAHVGCGTIEDPSQKPRNSRWSTLALNSCASSLRQAIASCTSIHPRRWTKESFMSYRLGFIMWSGEGGRKSARYPRPSTMVQTSVPSVFHYFRCNVALGLRIRAFFVVGFALLHFLFHFHFFAAEIRSYIKAKPLVSRRCSALQPVSND